MANFTIKGNKNSVINLDQSNSTWTVVASATITVKNNSAIFEDSGESGNTLINNGHVFADNGQHTVTIELDGEGTNFTNGALGVITGLTGVRLVGDHQTMVNQGLIDVSEEGVKIYGTQSSLTNHGKIFADGSALDLVDCDNSTITNADDGKIKSNGGTGVSFSTDTGVLVKFINSGLVTSKFDAISGSNGNDKVVNHGTLTGNVNFGDGNDLLDTRGGTFNGTLFGGDGNDMLITDKASIKFADSASEVGTDTVASTVSYTLNAGVEILRLIGKADIKGTGTGGAHGQQIYGNSGDNVIKGLGLSNTLAGGKGDDTLSGAFLPDTFLFATGDGNDTIKHFVTGEYADHLDVSKWNAIKDFSDLMANHIKNVGNDVVVFAGQDSVTIEGLHKGDLDDNNFFF